MRTHTGGPGPKGLRPEDFKFKASLDYTARLSQLLLLIIIIITITIIQ